MFYFIKFEIYLKINSLHQSLFMKKRLPFLFLMLFHVFVASASTIIAPPSATIAYNTPFCQSSTQETVTLIGTLGGTFSASPSSLSINPTTGTINPSTSVPGTYTVTYFIPSGVDPAFTATTNVTINAQLSAGTDGMVTICDSSWTTIDLFSIITGEQPGGTWTRVTGTGGTFNASAGTFTPAMGATSSVFIYTILGSNPCVDDISAATVTIYSQPDAGISGAITVCDSSTTTIDLFSIITGEQPGGSWTRTSGVGGTFNAAAGTFTPSPDATTNTFTYTIAGAAPCLNSSSVASVFFGNTIVPQFANIAPICVGSTPPILFNTSPNGITGSWNPSTIDTATVGATTYTFTPEAGQCAASLTITLLVVDSIVPEFTFDTHYFCEGSVPVLPTTSNNGITGTWSPSTIATGTGVYTFTPNPEQCASIVVETFSVSPAPIVTIAGSTTVCQGTSATVTFMGTPNSIVSYATDGGPIQTIALNASGMATITTPILNANTTICLVSVTSMPGNCTTNLSGCAIITVALNVIIPQMPDVTACGQYTLPALQIGGYFTAPNGGGTMLHAGDVITNTQLIYVYFPGMCSLNEESFVVTVIPVVNPTISTVGDINYIIVDGNQIVQTLQLNTEVQTGNYTYQWMESGDDIIGANDSSYTVNNLINGGLHYYSVRITNNDTNCVTESPVFQVFETPVPAPLGNPNQTFTIGQTLADVVVIGSNIQWYDGLGRNVNANPLPLSTLLVNGVTYYASQTINGHESQVRLAVTVQLTLSNNAFHFKNLTYSPNPVENVLNIKSTDAFNNIKVYNNLGQEVYQQKCNTSDLKLELEFLKTGNYFIRLESDKKEQVIKVIKK